MQCSWTNVWQGRRAGRAVLSAFAWSLLALGCGCAGHVHDSAGDASSCESQGCDGGGASDGGRISDGGEPGTLITYEADDTTNFPNPERGLSNANLFGGSTTGQPFPSSGNLYNFAANNRATDARTLVLLLARLDDFRSSPISAAYLAGLENACNTVRRAGAKLVLLFRYYDQYSVVMEDAPLARITAHLDQLASLLRDNADVIALVHAGFIGNWGEWHHAGFPGDHDQFGLDNTASRTAVLDKILSVLPGSRMVAIRKPAYKQEIFATAAPLDDTLSFGGSARARTGAHNDLFQADPSNGCTYVNQDTHRCLNTSAADIDYWKDWLRQDNRYVPQGGEPGGGTPSYRTCANSVEDFARLRYDYFHLDFGHPARTFWRDNGCLDEIQLKLGYRFRLVQALLPDAAQRGATLRLTVTLANDGWGGLFNARPLEIILRHVQTGAVHTLVTDADPRTWWPDRGAIDVAVSVAIPSDLAPGDYELLLNLPDPASSLHDDPLFSIRLANVGLWEAQTGYNSLLHTMTVD